MNNFCHKKYIRFFLIFFFIAILVVGAVSLAILKNKDQNFFTMSSFSSSNREDMNEIVSDISSCPDLVSDIPPLTFTDVVVRLQKNEECEDGIYISRGNTEDDVRLFLPEAIAYRPVSELEKIDENSFFIFVTANPHFGHYIVFDVEGKMLQWYSVGDDCFEANTASGDWRVTLEKKCSENPQFPDFYTAQQQSKQPILTSADFSPFGLKGDGRDALRGKSKNMFVVQIASSPDFIYTFKVASITTSSVGQITVFAGTDADTHMVQTISLDPNMRLADEVPLFFTIQDINFDGYGDIGVIVDGGATWGAYQYWVYDQSTKKFITAPVTDDIRKISFGDLEFVPSSQKIIARGLIGASGNYKKIYQYERGRIYFIEDHERMTVDSSSDSTKPIWRCRETIKTYVEGDVQVKTEELPGPCVSEMFE